MPLDYRSDPSIGGAEQPATPAASYDHPVEGVPTAPPTDQTWKSYDEQLDATRFGGINSPETSAKIFAEPSPHAHQGWSPEIDDALKFERAESGAPA